MTDDFTDALARLCSRELILARPDPDRIANMVERLAHSLAWTISIAAMGDPEKTQTLMTGVEQYLYADASGLASVASSSRVSPSHDMEQ